MSLFVICSCVHWMQSCNVNVVFCYQAELVEQPKPEEISSEVSLDMLEDVEMTSWLKPEYLTVRERLEVESIMYGYPSTLPGMQFLYLLC